MSPPIPIASSPRPVLDDERVGSIDALRGVALLGILAMNIQSFAMPGAAYLNPTAFGDLNGVNGFIWRASHLLADQKFMTIFSMLFGAGIVLMTSAHEQRAGVGAGAAVHYRRMGWLILFGVLHAHLLWYGDILYFYGMCGLAAYLFRRMPPSWLLAFGLVVISVPSLLFTAAAWSVPHWPAEDVAQVNAEFSPSADAIAAEIQAYRSGWLQQMWRRVPEALMFETAMFALWGAWRAGGLMLVGMALMKWGVFSAKRSVLFYVVCAAAGLALGVPLIGHGIRRCFEEQWTGVYVLFSGSQYNYWGSIPMSLAYVALMMLAWKSTLGRRLLRPVAAVGRMALTNYLMHTVLCTTIFYGHGFSLFGSVERTGQIGIVAAIWIAQLVWSPIWLSIFQFGPVEWAWRSLTYLKPQPMRRTTRAMPGPAATV